MPTLEEVKEYLRIDVDSEDNYLNVLVILAREMIENFLRKRLPRKIPPTIKQAALLICGYFYENREGTKEGIMQAVYYLLEPYRKVVF